MVPFYTLLLLFLSLYAFGTKLLQQFCFWCIRFACKLYSKEVYLGRYQHGPVAVPVLRMFSIDFYGFQSLHNVCLKSEIPPPVPVRNCHLQPDRCFRNLLGISLQTDPTIWIQPPWTTVMGQLKTKLWCVCMEGSKLNWQMKPDSCCPISGVLDLKSSQGYFNTVLCLLFPVVLEDPLGRKQQIIQYRNRSS